MDEEARRLLAQLAPQIISDHRAYLRATVVGPGTCTACRRDVPTPGLCERCAGHQAQYPGELADRVGFMTYAVPSAVQHYDKLGRLVQSGWLMHRYKEPWATDTDRAAVQMLCLVGLSFHMPCLLAQAGGDPPLWATVPSRRTDRTSTPLRDIALGLSRAPAREVLLGTVNPSRERVVRPDYFQVTKPIPPGAHVLLLEDTWVSGSTPQSAALTLRRAGAGQVSLLVLARWTRPDDPGTRKLLESIVGTDYALTFCPWTGAPCAHTHGPY
jgi:predicted amidophosphoribosyltransferase